MKRIATPHRFKALAITFLILLSSLSLPVPLIAAVMDQEQSQYANASDTKDANGTNDASEEEAPALPPDLPSDEDIYEETEENPEHPTGDPAEYPAYAPEYPAEYAPEYTPDDPTEYPTDPTPEYTPEYPTDYTPEYAPEYPTDYPADYTPEYPTDPTDDAPIPAIPIAPPAYMPEEVIEIAPFVAMDITDLMDITSLSVHKQGATPWCPNYYDTYTANWDSTLGFTFTMESDMLGDTVNEGDTVIFPLPQIQGGSGFLFLQDTPWQTFYDEYTAVGQEVLVPCTCWDVYHWCPCHWEHGTRCEGELEGLCCRGNYAMADLMLPLGYWRITAAGVEMVFGPNAHGLSLVQARFESGFILRASVQAGGPRKIVFGGLSHEITFAPRQMNIIFPNSWVTVESTTSHTIDWRIDLPRLGAIELGGKNVWGRIDHCGCTDCHIAACPDVCHCRPYHYGYIGLSSPGEHFTLQPGVMLEAALTGYLDSIMFHSRIARPNLATFCPYSPEATPSGRTQPVDFTSYMTEIIPRPDETYEDFRERVRSAPFQWGVWMYPNWEWTPGADLCCLGNDGKRKMLVVYFGTIGQDGPRLIDIRPDFVSWVANSAIVSDGWDESYRGQIEAWLWAMYGPYNAIGGRVPLPSVRIIEYIPQYMWGAYPYVAGDDPLIPLRTWIHNHHPDLRRTLFYDSGWGRYRTYLAALATPEGAGETAPPQGIARLALYDLDTLAPLPGAEFIVQSYRNGNWINLRRTITTNAQGTGDMYLGAGTFRLVQETVADPAIYTLVNPRHYPFHTTLNRAYSGVFTIEQRGYWCDYEGTGDCYYYDLPVFYLPVYNAQNPRLTVIVVDQHQQPIPGANIYVDNQTFTANSAGYTTIQLLPETTVTIAASHPHKISPAATTITIDFEDKEATIILTLVPGDDDDPGCVGDDCDEYDEYDPGCVGDDCDEYDPGCVGEDCDAYNPACPDEDCDEYNPGCVGEDCDEYTPACPGDDCEEAGNGNGNNNGGNNTPGGSTPDSGTPETISPPPGGNQPTPIPPLSPPSQPAPAQPQSPSDPTTPQQSSPQPHTQAPHLPSYAIISPPYATTMVEAPTNDGPTHGTDPTSDPISHPTTTPTDTITLTIIDPTPPTDTPTPHTPRQNPQTGDNSTNPTIPLAIAITTITAAFILSKKTKQA